MITTYSSYNWRDCGPVATCTKGCLIKRVERTDTTFRFKRACDLKFVVDE